MAATLNEQVISTDIAAEVRWKDDRWCEHALAHGLRACWSSPIVASGGKVLGTFALYFRHPCSPTGQHHEIIERLTHLASIAIERAQAEDALRHSERQRRQAQRLEAMGTLAGGIAHDFNNLLGAILGYGERALRDAPRQGRLRRDLESIVAAGERGRSLVDSVLTFSRSGVGELVLVHVEGVVREVLDLLDAKLPDGIVVEAELDAGRAAMQGDPTQVHQILMNLATNAIQAMPDGGTLRVALKTVRNDTPRAATIGTLAAGEYIVLAVEDAGVGIPADLIDRIFDPFFTTKEVGAGTGLGLSLVHGVVMEVGGAIDLASTVGAGSRFTVHLPRSGDAPDDAAGADTALPKGRGQRVLVVDDEEPLVRLATDTLNELGYAATGFTSSTAAVDAFRADAEGFDAVITDERMPGVSGSTLIQVVRQARRSVPIVLLSGNTGGMVTARAYNAGANEVLKKPLSARELAVTLARVLQA
jgi:signal transduction histidine kinase